MTLARATILTRRQRTVLQTLEFHNRSTPRSLGARIDVLLRLEERGFAARNAHGEWHITDRGREAIT